MEMLQGVWKQHLRPRAVVGYGVKIFLPSPPNYVTRSPGSSDGQRRQRRESLRTTHRPKGFKLQFVFFNRENKERAILFLSFFYLIEQVAFFGSY